MHSKIFGRLLKAGINSAAMCEGKTAPIIEAELGQKIGVSVPTIQRYKAGHIPPELRTVQILAELAVERGHLNQDWLRDFLNAARFPAPEKIISRYYPDIPSSTALTRGAIPHNLPAATYNHFVMRHDAFTEVVNGLCQRSAVVLIVGLAGMGKTSLAREVASIVLYSASGVPQFDAVVWISDNNQPGELQLNNILDEIARTLDYTGYLSLDFDSKLHLIDRLLRQHRILLIVDNFETVRDNRISSWLLQIPEPGKVIVTSREYSREFRNNTYVVDLHGMTDTEVQEFVNQKLKFLRLQNLIQETEILSPLLDITYGNPKSIETALGYIKYEHRSLAVIVGDLVSAHDNLFNDLFSRCWSLLNDAAQRILLCMPLFKNPASTEALLFVSDISNFTFNAAIDQLADLALIETQQADINSAPRYTLHPLVRAFALEKIRDRSEFEIIAQNKWVNWYIQLASEVGYSWKDIRRLEILDMEQDSIHSVVNWIVEHQLHNAAIDLVKGVGYYYFVRGLWNKDPKINLVRAGAARSLGLNLEEIEALAYHIQILSRQQNLVDADNHTNRLNELVNQTVLPSDMYFNVQHAIALNALAQGDYDIAYEAWNMSISLADALPAHLYVVNLQWLATCLYHKGDTLKAQSSFQEALHLAVRYGIPRSILFCKVKLAIIEIENGDFDNAGGMLSSARTQAYYYQDREHMAEVQRAYAHLYFKLGDREASRNALLEAIGLFERLGLQRELDEANNELAHFTT